MKTGSKKKKLAPYLWLLPSIVLIATFVVFPIMIVFRLSFSEISKSGVIGGFNGIQNYVDAVRPAGLRTAVPVPEHLPRRLLP